MKIHSEAVEAMLSHDSYVPTAPLDEFILAYAEDDNLWWRIDCGHHQNLFEAAVETLEEAAKRITKVRQQHAPADFQPDMCVTCLTSLPCSTLMALGVN